MASFDILMLPGDGIGPEVMAEAKTVLTWLNGQKKGTFQTEEDLVGGSAYDKHQVAVSEAAMAKALKADAVLFGAVGGPKWDKVPYGSGAVRQPAAGDLLPGARGCVVLEA
jgi:3-isopropylmalate dehydrogenase